MTSPPEPWRTVLRDAERAASSCWYTLNAMGRHAARTGTREAHGTYRAARAQASNVRALTHTVHLAAQQISAQHSLSSMLGRPFAFTQADELALRRHLTPLLTLQEQLRAQCVAMGAHPGYR